MQAIFSWIKNIVFFLLFVTVASHMMPDKKYDKYVKLFTGLILMLLILRPIVSCISSFSIDDTNVIEQIENMMEEGKTEGSISEKTFEQVNQKRTKEAYYNQVQAFVREEASRLGLVLVSFRMETKTQEDTIVPEAFMLEVRAEKKGLDEITIPQILLEETEAAQTKETKQLKKILEEYYGVEEGKVQVSVV